MDACREGGGVMFCRIFVYVLNGRPVTLSDRIESEELYKRLGNEKVTDVVGRSRLRWFSHVEHMDQSEWVSSG